jgi:RHS repeat-associated protein
MPCTIDYTIDGRCLSASTHTVQVLSACAAHAEDGECVYNNSNVSPVVGFSIPQPPKPSLSGSYDPSTDSVTLHYDWAMDSSYLPSVQVYVDGIQRNDSFSDCTAQLSGTCSVPLALLCSSGDHKVHLVGARCQKVDDPDFTATVDLVAHAADCKKEATECGTPSSCPTCTIPPNPCTDKAINVGSGDARADIPLFSVSQNTSTLQFTFTAHSTPPQFASRMVSPFGDPRSTHTFNQSLIAVAPARLQWLTASGDRHFFDQVTDTLWQAATPASSRDTVLKNGDGTYTLHHVDGSSVRFDGSTCSSDSHLCGRWLSDADRWGNTVSGIYGTDGATDHDGNFRPFLSKIVDNEGREYTFTYSSGVLSTIQLPDGGLWRFTLSAPMLYIFDPLHTGNTPWRSINLSTITVFNDANQTIEDHWFDNALRANVSLVGNLMRPLRVAYDTPAAGQSTVTTVNSTSVNGPARDTQTLSLSFIRGTFLPTQVTGTCSACGGSSESMSYVLDDHGQATSVTNGSGVTTQYQYDSFGNTVRRTDAAGTPLERTTTFAFENSSWPTFMTRKTETSATGSGSKVTTASWNADETVLTASVTGKLVASGPTVTYTTIRTYDNHHRLIAVNGPRTDVADVTQFTYYSDSDPNVLRRGRLATTTDALGHTTRFDDYDLFGNARTVTDPNGVVTTRQTDARGRVISSTSTAVAGDPNESASYITTYLYDSRDYLTDVITPRGIHTKYLYVDGIDWLTDTIHLDGNGNEIERRHLTLDPIGEKTQEEDQICTTPASTCTSWVTKRSESYTYNQQSRLASIQHPIPAGSQVLYAYDPDGKLLSVQDENHSTPNTLYSYDSLSRLQSVHQTLSSAPGGSIGTTYQYDPQDNLTAVTDPNGNTTLYSYDDFHRLQTQVSPVTGTTTYAYDEASNLLLSTDANQATTSRTYDALNRVTSATSTRSGSVTETTLWTYDDTTQGAYCIGRLATMSDPTGATNYKYERRGLMTEERKTIESALYVTQYAYDSDGNRSRVVSPSGRAETTTFDFADRPIAVTSGTTPIVTSTSYLPFGPATQWIFGNGTTRQMDYDARYRPSRNKLTTAGATIADYTYGEDAVGNITQIHDALAAAYNRDFGYDDLNRLVAANTGASLWGTGSYSYDAMGNVLSSSIGSRSDVFTYAGATPRLASVSHNGLSTAVTYDSAGNELSADGSVSSYSARNERIGSGTASYAYDGRGIRTITRYPQRVVAISGTPQTLFPNQTGTAHVALDSPGVTGGTVVTLTSSSAAIVVPSSITVPEGNTGVDFTYRRVAAAHTAQETVTASLNGMSASLVLTLAPGPDLAGISTSSASIAGGSSFSATVTLSAAAPVNGAPILLNSNSATVGLPSTANVPEGQTSLTVDAQTSPVSADVVVTLTATYDSSSTTTVTVLSPVLQALTPQSQNVPARGTATLTATLTSVAPAGGTTISLTSSDSSLLTVPASVLVPAGAASVAFTVSAGNPATDTPITVTATLRSVSRTANVVVGACASSHAVAPTIPSGDTVLMEDAFPSDATVTGNLHWLAQQASSGNQSLSYDYAAPAFFIATVSGLHQAFEIGENAVFYMLVNECAPPREILVRWTTSDTYAVAYWGQAGLLGGEGGGLNMGPVPAGGNWIRVEIPLKQLHLEQQTLIKMDINYQDGQVWFDHFGKSGTACIAAHATPPSVPAGDTVLIDDSLPSGATITGDYRWKSTQAATGSQSLTFNYFGPAFHQASITDISQPFNTGENAVFYMLINECAEQPREILVRWTTSPYDYNVAYWGQAGVLGGESGGVNMGPIPNAGNWVRVEIPLSQLHLEQKSLIRLDINYQDGQVFFDHFGKSSGCIAPHATQPTIPPGDTVLMEDAFPSDATVTGNLHWLSTQAASGTRSLSYDYAAPAFFIATVSNLHQAFEIGENAVFYMLVNECAPPREILVRWTTSDTYAVAYWGQAGLLGGEGGGLNMGPVPAGGNWIRVEIPLKQLHLEQQTLIKMDINYQDGQVWFDHIGKSGTACIAAHATPPTVPAGDTVLIDDAVPSGATITGDYRWKSTQAATGSQSLTFNYFGPAFHQASITDIGQPFNTGENAVFYMLINECAEQPREILVRWTTSPYDYNVAYWGQAGVIGGESGGVNMGPIPNAGNWVRVEIPLSQLHLEQKSLIRLDISYQDGQIFFDHFAKSGPAPATITAFSADHASPQPAGTTVTWTASAYAPGGAAEYRFERQDNGAWSIVQAYSSLATYSWTPNSSDVGDHAVRVSVRNLGAPVDLQDTRTLSITITGGSGSLRGRLREFFAVMLHERGALSLGTRPDVLDAPSGTRRYTLYNQTMNLVAETETTNAATPAIAYEYVWFGGQPIAQVEVASGTTHYYFNDHIGTPLLTTSATGVIDWRMEREPYGASFANRVSTQRYQPISLPGQENGAAEDYNIFRWYRAGWGRYTQADPVGVHGGLNLYSYANGNPIARVDPRGLCSSSCPDCPGKIWGVYGVDLGFTVKFGPFGWGSSVGIFNAKCFSSGKKCTFFSICDKGFGVGASVSLTGNVGATFNAPCASDIEGESWGIDAEVGKEVGGSVSGEVGSTGAVTGKLGFGFGWGASGTFNLCKVFTVVCN